MDFLSPFHSGSLVDLMLCWRDFSSGSLLSLPFVSETKGENNLIASFVTSKLRPRHGAMDRLVKNMFLERLGLVLEQNTVCKWKTRCKF